MKTGLLLIDIQNDYFPGGSYELYKAEDAADNAKIILDVFHKKKMPVFFIQHINMEKDAKIFAPYSKGVDFYKEVYPLDYEARIIKYTPDSFFQTTLLSKLRFNGINHLVVCGMMTHMCVDTTVRSAVNYGFKVTLIEDACATRDLEGKNGLIKAQTVQNVFMSALNNTFADVQTTEEWCKTNS